MKKELVVKILSRVSYFLGFTSLFNFLNRDRKKVLAYHNVIPDRYYDGKLHLLHSHRESSFDKHIEVIKQSYEVDTEIENEKSITITFDDGYKNQYEIASKILDKYNIKGIFFFSGALIESEEMFLMDKVEYWFSYVPFGNYGKDIKIDREEERIEEKNRFQQEIVPNYSKEEILEKLNGFYPFGKITMPDENYRKLRFSTITVENIEEMKKKGHIVAAHSYFHNNLANLSDIKLEEDISKCRDLRERKIYNSDIFCYPFGGDEDINDKTIESLKKNGFSKALAYTNVKNERDFDNYFIPRMTIPDTEDSYIINFYLSGAKHFLMTKKLFPKWRK